MSKQTCCSIDPFLNTLKYSGMVANIIPGPDVKSDSGVLSVREARWFNVV